MVNLFKFLRHIVDRLKQSERSRDYCLLTFKLHDIPHGNWAHSNSWTFMRYISMNLLKREINKRHKKCDQMSFVMLINWNSQIKKKRQRMTSSFSRILFARGNICSEFNFFNSSCLPSFLLSFSLRKKRFFISKYSSEMKISLWDKKEFLVALERENKLLFLKNKETEHSFPHSFLSIISTSLETLLVDKSFFFPEN